jgi:hypothetical protein
MNVLQHRNHVADGSWPVEGCYWCERIVMPSLRVKRVADLCELDIYAGMEGGMQFD